MTLNEFLFDNPNDQINSWVNPTDLYFGKLYQAMIINRRPREKLDFDTPKNRFFSNFY